MPPLWVPVLAASLVVNVALAVLLGLAWRDRAKAWTAARLWHAHHGKAAARLARMQARGVRLPEELIKTKVFDPSA